MCRNLLLSSPQENHMLMPPNLIKDIPFGIVDSQLPGVP